MDKARRRTRRVLPLILFGAVFVGGLGPFFGFWRAVVGFLIAATILTLGIGYFRSAGQSQPETTPEEVGATDLRYVCSVCGLELKVVVATNDKAPSHCREKMELVTVAGKPPLKPV